MSKRRKVRVNHRNTKPRKDSKSIPLYGSPERGDGIDDGKYYQCWNCGFTCNLDRDALGDSQSKDGITTKSYALLDEYGNAVSTTGGAKHTIFSGEGYTTVRYEPDVNSGCPFCGTLNWRGDY